METKETTANCCATMGSKHKKVFVIVSGLVLLAIIAVTISAIGWKIHEARNGGYGMYGYADGGRGTMNRGKVNYSIPVSSTEINQFALPQDASKSGELAVVVSNLDVAKKAVFDIAEKSKGNVYATFIAYASNNLKNGSIVVQVPAENFNSAFEDLKKISTNVVQESTQQISLRSPLPTPMIAEAQPATDATAVSEDETASDSQEKAVPEASAEIAIYPNPVQPQTLQDKGYIRIIFVDYGKIAKNDDRDEKQYVGGNILGVGNQGNQDMRNNLIVIIGLKLILLVAILGLLVVIFKKIFSRIKVRKENKKRVHIVRMMPKTQKRVIRIAKRK
jgi:hypothetical protein